MRTNTLPRHVGLRLLLAAALAPIVGCQDPDFNRPELLERPRILAMQAEPPQPAFGAATTLRALIYEPPATTDASTCEGVPPGPTYAWEWCPVPTSSANGFACPVDQLQLDALFVALGLGPAPRLFLGNGETATLTNPFPAALLNGICTGDIPIDPRLIGVESLPTMGDAGIEWHFPCDEPSLDDPEPNRPLGFPVTVRLTYTPPCGSPHQEKYGDTLKAVFTVHLPTDDALPPNQNPVVGSVFAIDYQSVLDAPDAGAAPDLAPPAAVDASELDAQAAIDGGVALDGGAEIDGGAGTGDGAPAVPDAAPVTGDAALPSSPTGSVPLERAVLPRNKRVRLWIDLAGASAEPLARPGLLDRVEDGKTYHFERLSVLWFAEAGDFGGEHGNFGRETGFTPTYNSQSITLNDEGKMEEARQLLWALPLYKDYPHPSARIVVVIRDSRGGVTWTSAVANVAEAKR